MNKSSSITIIGASVVGCAIAFELSKNGYTNIKVIERNTTVTGQNQSNRSGGVIHSGIYYPQDIEPLKAKLCVEGNRLLYEFCQKYNLPHIKTGKLILALNNREEEYLDFFLKVGIENGVSGITKFSQSQARKMVPNLGNFQMALYVPSTGSAALSPIVEKLKELSESNGVSYILNSRVMEISPGDGNFVITTSSGTQTKTLETDVLINAAGLYSDKIARMVNPELNYEIDPARGELFEYKVNRGDISINGIHIYSSPYFYYNESKKKADLPIDEVLNLLKSGQITKTLGIHLSPVFENVDGQFLLGNTVSVGPLKTLGYGKEDYTTNLKTTSDCVAAVNQFFPNLTPGDLKPRFVGIMAVLKGKTDYVIERDSKYPNCINLVGIDSPAWTAALSIAKYVGNKVNE